LKILFEPGTENQNSFLLLRVQQHPPLKTGAARSQETE